MTAPNRSTSPRSLRLSLLVGVSVATLTMAGAAQAQNMGARNQANPAAQAAQAAQTAAQRNAAAEAAAQRTRASFEAASRARASMDAAQQAAREAARIAQTNIPNGLGEGGLQQAAGIDIDPTLWVGANGPTQTTGENGRTAVTIDQTQEKAILTWETFNVGRETDLTFNHQGNRDWMTLNRVSDPNANATQILGSIRAEGSVYIINPNGVIFGGASQVNVRSLIASSLDIHGGAIEYTRPAGASDEDWNRLKLAARDARFNAGLLSSSGSTLSFPISFSDGAGYSYVTSYDPDEVFDAYDGVTVEAGARITVAPLGQAVLLGHNVVNRGSITANDGQVLLAAGRDVALVDGANRQVRNANSSATRTADLVFPGFSALTTRGGEAVNAGIISAERGNVYVNAKTIRQDGVIAVTTGIEQRGSIVLDATTGFISFQSGANPPPTENRGPVVERPDGTIDPIGAGRYWGSVTFGEGSHTSILGDESNRTTVGDTFKPSEMIVVGNRINFSRDSTLLAPGASLTLMASGYRNGRLVNNDEAGRIYIESGAVIDVSGLNGVELDMEQNSVRAELRANELADNPVLRDSILRGETVWFDGRLGEKLTDGTGIADLSGWYDLIARDVSQFMTTGGSIHMSGAEIIQREGSTIDLSGGSVVYNDGVVRRTRLIDEFGRIVPIEFAQAGVNYVGVEGDFVVNHARWGVTERFTNPFARTGGSSWQRGYVEGRSAGTLEIAFGGPRSNYIADTLRIFDGDVRAGIVQGDYQVDAPGGADVTDLAHIWRERPKQGTLIFGGLEEFGAFYLSGGSITIADLGPRLTGEFGADTAVFDYQFSNNETRFVPQIDGIAANEHVLPSSWFDGANFGDVTLYSGTTNGNSYALSSTGQLVLKDDRPALGGVLTIGEGVTVDLGDYGSFNFTGRQAQIDGTIRAAGGSVNLLTLWEPAFGVTVPWASIPDTYQPGTHLGSTGVIDVSGRWTNNYLEAVSGGALTAPVVDGGQVKIVGYNVVLDEGSRISVNGGASLDTDGATLTLGDGGAIVIDTAWGRQVGSGPSDGVLELNGTLTGTAPGKGGSLTIDTNDDIVIAEDWGDLASIVDGVLEAGTAAPKDLVLSGPVTIPAGTPLPVDGSTSTNVIPPDGILAESAYAWFYDESNPVILGDTWTVPAGVMVYDSDWNEYYSGAALPAGTALVYIDGTWPAGFQLSGEAFPDGLTLSNNVPLVVLKGSVLESDYIVTAGTSLAKGTVLTTDASVSNRIRLVTPDWFNGGGGAADDWGALNGIADGVLEAGVAAPTQVRLAGALIIPTGAAVPTDISYQTTTAPSGMVFSSTTNINYFSGLGVLETAADWTVPTGYNEVSGQRPDGTSFSFTSWNGTLGTPAAFIPAGSTITYMGGNLPAGSSLPSSVFPDGVPVSNPLTLQVAKGSIASGPLTLPAGTILDAGTVLDADARVLFASRLGGESFAQHGFANYALSGSRGMTVTSGVTIAPTVDSISLTGAVRDLATGVDLAALARAGTREGIGLLNSADLLVDQRQTTDILLSSFQATASGIGERRNPLDVNSYNPIQWLTAARNPGSLTIEDGVTIDLTPGSTAAFDSRRDIYIGGTISTPGGTIRVAPFSATTQVVRIGENARLLAGGYERTDYVNGLAMRSVVAGGEISIGYSDPFDNEAQSSSSSARNILIGQGALLDASGAAGFTDYMNPGAGFSRQPTIGIETHGAGGRIVINGNSGLIAGELRLAAGGETGHGGTLTLASSQESNNPIVIQQAIGEDVGSVIPTTTASSGSLTVFADRINGAGADSITLYSPNEPGIRFDGDVTLEGQREIILLTNRIHRAAGAAAAVEIIAPYVKLGEQVRTLNATGTDLAAPVYANDLDGSFTVRAGLIDVAAWIPFDNGAVSGGFGDVRLVADGDIRFRRYIAPNDTGNVTVTAGLSSGGAIRLESAQVYVVNGINVAAPSNAQYETREDDPGFLVRAGRSITVQSNGNAAPTPLNFGERLTLRAPEIVQAGVLRAPAGQIRLEAVDTVDADGNAVAGRITLAPGSLTSVSLDGLTVPFGVLTQEQWFGGYPAPYSTATRVVELTGADVDVQAGATVDVSGGGDLLGWTFLPGTGGTRNILDDRSASGAFAILPSLGNAPAPIHTNAPNTGDFSASGSRISNSTTLQDGRLQVGDNVWLQGVPGLADGYYTLLPAGYAVLEGALLVKPLGGAAVAPVATQRRDDGSVVASGYRAVSGTPIRDAAWSSWQVMDADTWRQYSNISTVSFNTTKAAQAAAAGMVTPTLNDAGTLAVRAFEALNLAGSVDFSAANGALGNLDISGERIALTAGGVGPDGYLAVDARQIEALNPGSVLIGGRRPRTTFEAQINNLTSPPVWLGQRIATDASEVLVADGLNLTVRELLLVGRDRVSVGDGAVLTAQGSGSFLPDAVALSGDGAFLRLSSNERVGLNRTGANGATGELAIGSGTRLVTAGALTLDASTGFELAADAVFDVAQLDLASDRINLGDVPSGVEGTSIGLETLTRLAGSSDLLLRGYQAIAFYGDVALGGRSADGRAELAAITFDTADLRGDGGDVTLTAGTLTLRNSGQAEVTESAGTGTLRLDVDTLALGPGATAIGGFDGLRGTAGEVRTSGTGALSVGGDIDLASGRLVAGAASDYRIAASDAVRFVTLEGASAADATNPLGGSLAITGETVALDTSASARGGKLDLTARSGDLTLGENARLDVAGAAVDFGDTSRFAPGGVVRLTAARDVTAQAGSVIDVSGAERGGDSGALAVNAGGHAGLSGELRAASASGETGGVFTLEAATTDFSTLNAALNAGNFSAERSLTLGAQDIVLAAGEVISAHKVSLTALNGDVTIAGTIAANGDEGHADGGIVTLLGNNVTLASSGRIDAEAGTAPEGGYAPASGRVVLAADQGRVVLASGSAIDLSGGREGGGRLSVRAQRTSSGADVDLSGTVTGAREKLLVGSRVYAADTVDAALVSTVLNDANSWLVGASAPTGWETGAGIVIRSAGDLTVSDDIDLAGVAGPGYLGLEAAGDLIIDANVSDGFASASADAALESGASFDYSLAAGGNLTIGELVERTPPIIIAGGEPLDQQRSFAAALPLTISANWSGLPNTVSYVRTASGQFYQWFATIPAGSTIIEIVGTFPAGYVLPADVFPQGLTFPGNLPAFTGTGRIVRTGTGDIDVRAGRDLRLGNESVIYTAGRATATDAAFDRTGYGTTKDAATRVLGEFPTLGGNVTLTAGGDIVAPTVAQSASAWLFRYGAATWNGDPSQTTVTEQTNWSVVFRNFQYGVGALGGGNVAVRAGGDVRDLAVAIPTTGYQITPVGAVARESDLVVRGGGSLDLRAYGDILGGAFLLGQGHARLAAGGTVGEGATLDVAFNNLFSASPTTSLRGLNPLFGLMDATAEVTAARGVTIDAAYDPMMSPQICENLIGACATASNGNTTTGGTGTAFVGYSSRAGLSALSAGGDIAYQNNGWHATSVSRLNRNLAFRIVPSTPPGGAFPPQNYLVTASVAPGTLDLASLSGSLRLAPQMLMPGLNDNLTLAASPVGTLNLLAANDVRLEYTSGSGIRLDDTGVDYIRDAMAPLVATDVRAVSLFPIGDPSRNVGNNGYRGYDLLHADDAEPLRIVALAGSIGAENFTTAGAWRLTSPKPVQIYAGTDINRPSLNITHTDASQVSALVAGRDFAMTSLGNVTILGPGLLWVEAGRNYDVGLTRIHTDGNGGIRSVGNGVTMGGGNLALPDVGADIQIVAGTAQGANYAAFAALYFDPANRADPAFGLSHPSNQGKVVHTYETELEDWLRGRGFSDVTEENRLALFESLPEAAQKSFINGVLLTELQQTGVDYNDTESSRFQQYTRGYSALHLLFPAAEGLDRSDNPLGGNILLNNGLVESRSGGSINLIAPYGRIAVGNPLEVSSVPDGVITRRGGDIGMLANGTISLERSRVFTLQGGDILMWTSQGDITAGVGTKTQVSSVPLSFANDASGRTTLNVFGLATGAGIGVLDALLGEDEEREPSRLDLLAFFGEVNAGDAGIRVVGDINIAALRVVNAANIEVSGEAVGIPQVATVNVGALNAASAATSAIVNEAAQLAERSRPAPIRDIPTIVTVTFAGFGE